MPLNKVWIVVVFAPHAPEPVMMVYRTVMKRVLIAVARNAPSALLLPATTVYRMVMKRGSIVVARTVRSAQLYTALHKGIPFQMNG